ncbi:hypothetical protein P171DRAFT_483106 [Karstenula rhodostoma CBS 690.94]|uniref:Uncharacterized protein n=1 Tax=Karstenula rhodostoma CBS 690.94 TaxID=1392251 RepID=A0A9P4PN44_9PLEO|nr:hypothetical protein P171DRAFT_483106 [Karstenula rhodostoma CBS 690.94]
MSQIPPATIESNQDPSGRFECLTGSMRKGFKSLCETLKKKKKKSAADPTTYQPQISAPMMMKQDDAESGPSGVSAMPEPTPLALPPSRLPIRILQRDEQVHEPSGVSTKSPPTPLNIAWPRLPIRNPRRTGGGVAGAGEVPVSEPLRKFKMKRPAPEVHESYVEELPTPPPSETRSSRSVEGERQVGATMGIESALDTVKHSELEDCGARQSTAVVPEVLAEEVLPSTDAKDESAAYSMVAFIDRIQAINERMVDIKPNIAQELEKDECDPALEERGSRVIEQVASLPEEVASIESECKPTAPDMLDVMMAASELVAEIMEEARQLAHAKEEEREEVEKNKPPPNAPKAPRAMLERQAQRAATVQPRPWQSQSWGQNRPPAYVQKQVNYGGNFSSDGRPSQWRPYNSQSMPRGGYRSPAPNPRRRHNPQNKLSRLQGTSEGNSQSISRSGPPSQPTRPYETWTMPRGGWPQDHTHGYPQRPPPITAMFHNSWVPGASSAATFAAPGPTSYFTGYNPYESNAPMGWHTS